MGEPIGWVVVQTAGPHAPRVADGTIYETRFEATDAMASIALGEPDPAARYTTEPVGGSPEVERSVAVRVAIRDADMIERVLGVLEGHGTVSMTEIRTAIGAVERIRRALVTPSESGTPEPSDPYEHIPEPPEAP